MPETQEFRGRSDILDRIVETKKQEVKKLLPREALLRDLVPSAPPVRDLLSALRRPGEVALMAEVKRRSPGAGPIRPGLVPAGLAEGYERAGAAAVSVLTDADYFGGSLEDLQQVRGAVSLPVFRKDFILHPLQLLEARAAGADGALLIARILPQEVLSALHLDALALGLMPIVEVHSGEELEKALNAGCRILGINNRNLQTFATSLDVTLDLLPSVPREVTVISESGIRTPAEVDRLGNAGVDAILVGETLLRAEDPESAAAGVAGRKKAARGGL